LHGWVLIGLGTDGGDLARGWCQESRGRWIEGLGFPWKLGYWRAGERHYEPGILESIDLGHDINGGKYACYD